MGDIAGRAIISTKWTLADGSEDNMIGISIGLKDFGIDMVQEEKSSVGIYRTYFTNVMEVHHSACHHIFRVKVALVSTLGFVDTKQSRSRV